MKLKKDGTIDKRTAMERLNKYPVTEALIKFIKEHNLSNTDKQLLALIANNPEWQWVNFSALRHIKTRHRIVKQHQQPYTEDEIEFIKNNFMTMGDVELAKNLPRHSFKSVHKMRRVYLGLRRDEAHQKALLRQVAAKGHAGRRKKIEEGTFFNHRYRTVGEIYQTNKSRYWFIKPTNERLTRPICYHRWLWEQAYGKVKKGYVVRFIDGTIPSDPDLISIDLLECVSWKEHGRKNALQMSDNYIAGRLFGRKNGLDVKTLKETGIIDLKRTQLALQKELKNILHN